MISKYITPTIEDNTNHNEAEASLKDKLRGCKVENKTKNPTTTTNTLS